MNGKSLKLITNAGEVFSIYEFIKGEEKKMRNGIDSIFNYGNTNQTSYPKKGFCSAAVGSLFNYREALINDNAVILVKASENRTQLINKLKKITSISDTESNAEVYIRIGQNIFRSVLLEIYNGQCYVCGLNIQDFNLLHV